MYHPASLCTFPYISMASQGLFNGQVLVLSLVLSTHSRHAHAFFAMSLNLVGRRTDVQELLYVLILPSLDVLRAVNPLSSTFPR
jgi:hypothetical protein